jgi:hypothetical protein
LRGAHRPIRHDCEDDRILRFTRNETRSLSLMFALRVNSGIEKLKDRRVYAFAIRLNLLFDNWECRAPRSRPHDAPNSHPTLTPRLNQWALARNGVDRAQERRKIIGLREEDSMRLISFSATVLSAFLSSAVLAQQPLTGDATGHPPQIPGPPPISEPSAAKQPTPAASAPEANEPASKGYIGAYGSPGPASP